MPRGRSFGRSELGKAITRGRGGGGSRSKGVTGVPRITQRRQNITTIRSPYKGQEYVDIWRYPDQDQTAETQYGTGGITTGGGTPDGPTADPAPGGWYQYGHTVEGAPDWWKAMAHTDLDERRGWLAQLNLMIPYLTAEDQRTAARILYQEEPEGFGHLAPDLTSFGAIAQDLGKADRAKWLGGGRAQGILEAIESLQTEVGKSDADMGSGFRWLQNVGQALKDFGGQEGRGPSKTDYRKLLAAWNPLQEQAPEGFGQMGRMALMPFFSGDELMPMSQTFAGDKIFGKASRSLFF